MGTAVIVAAGLSSRLYPLTKSMPKSLLPLSEETILQRHIRLLRQNGFSKIIIIVGYLHEKIKSIIGPDVEYIYNPFYKYCNNMGSLWYAQFMIKEPFLYLHADLVYSESLLAEFLKNVRQSDALIDFALDYGEVDEEAMKVLCTEEGRYIQSSKEISLSDAAGEWIGLTYIRDSSVMFNEIERILSIEKLNVYDTYAFNELAKKGLHLQCHSIQNEKWVEVDFIEDYERAKEIFS